MPQFCFLLLFNAAPHQPRLDWQMWFAALGSYQHNPWFVHLVYKLLHGENDVLDLMASKQPFKTPPHYVRAILYKYHYTKYKRNASTVNDVIHNIRFSYTTIYYNFKVGLHWKK